MIRALFLFVAFAFSSSAFSAGIVAVGPNSYRVVPTGKSDRGMTWAAPQFGAVATTAAVASSSRSLTIVGEAVEVVGRQTLSRAAMVAGIGAVFAGPVGGPVLAVTGAVLDQLAQYGQLEKTPGGYVHDPGVDKINSTAIRYICDGSNGQAITADLNICVSEMQALCVVQGGSNCSERTATATSMTNDVGQCVILGAQGLRCPTAVPVQVCPQNSFSGSEWANGRCKSSTRISPQDQRAIQALAAAFDALSGSSGNAPAPGTPRLTPQQIANLARDMADNGIEMPLDQSVEASGPAQVEGKPKEAVTNKADGTQEKTISKDIANCTYSGSNVNCSVTTNITNQTITNNNGVTNTVTNSTTTKPAEPDPDPCLSNPSRVGCMPTGDLPGDAPTWRTADVVFAADALGLPAYCPGPQTWVLPHVSRPLSWSYQPACDVAPMVRAAMLALTALGCVLLIIRTVRT